MPDGCFRDARKELPFPQLIEETTRTLCTLLVGKVWSLARSVARSVLRFDGHWKEIKLEDVHREEFVVARV